MSAQPIERRCPNMPKRAEGKLDGICPKFGLKAENGRTAAEVSLARTLNRLSKLTSEGQRAFRWP